MYIQTLHTEAPVLYSNFAAEKENPGITQKGIPDDKLRDFLARWQLALSNANTDDWRMVINFYSHERKKFDFPSDIDTIFLSSQNNPSNIGSFVRSQRSGRVTMAAIISKHLENLK